MKYPPRTPQSWHPDRQVKGQQNTPNEHASLSGSHGLKAQVKHHHVSSPNLPASGKGSRKNAFSVNSQACKQFGHTGSRGP